MNLCYYNQSFSTILDLNFSETIIVELRLYVRKEKSFFALDIFFKSSIFVSCDPHKFGKILLFINCLYLTIMIEDRIFGFNFACTQYNKLV